MIKLSNHINEHQMAVMANLDQSEFWQIIKHAIDVELSALEDEIRKSPRFCDDDLTEDLRFKMGGIDRLKWVLELPSEARAILTQR